MLPIISGHFIFFPLFMAGLSSGGFKPASCFICHYVCYADYKFSCIYSTALTVMHKLESMVNVPSAFEK